MTEEVAYQVKVDVYQGPFDLLVAAIDEGKIDIFSVSLAQIAISYLDYFRREAPDLTLASDFLLMAAYLLELKSRQMLPVREEIIEEEMVSGLEESLLQHIEEYKIFKDLAHKLRERKNFFEKIYGRHEGEPEEHEIALKDVSLRDLAIAFKRVYDEAARREAVVPIAAEEITLDERIIEIKRLLAGPPQAGLPFEDLFLRRTRLEVVVTFLAILELAREKFIQITQGRTFGSILVFACLPARQGRNYAVA